MRRLGVSTLSALLLLLAAASASGARAQHKAPAPCPPPHAHVLLADGQAAVYSVHEAEFIRFVGGGGETQALIATRGCTYARGGSYKIWDEAVPRPIEVNEGIADLALSGTIVAYNEWSYGGNRYTPPSEERPFKQYVIVRNLRTDRVLHRVPTGMKEPDHPMTVGDGPTAAIVVKSNGAVAWVLDTVQSENRYQVHALDKTGERVLATGSNIDPHSLALAGSTLYWTQGGKPMSATLN